MNSFDWGMYDQSDSSPPKKSIKKTETVESFDWDLYDPPETKKAERSLKSYGKTLLKGAVEGISSLGRMMGPLETGQSTEEQLKAQSDVLNQLLPTEDTFEEKAVRRGLNIAPSAMAFPGGPVQAGVRSLLAGFTGEGAKELGAPEWAQSAAEITAFLGPDITKKLISSGNNKEIIESARKLGISDEAITPLIQSNFKKKWLAKLSPRRGRTKEALSKTKSELSEARQSLVNEGENQLNSTSSQNLMIDIEDKLFEMPSGVREKISKDFKDLTSQPITDRSLMNFWADINHELGSKTRQLSLLKEPLKKALEEIDPVLAKNFETVNSLFSKYYDISAKLEPNLMTDIIGAGKALGILGGVITGYYPLILKFGGEHAAQSIAREMLINPRFQQISRKMINALNQNKFGVAKKLSNLFAYNLKEISPEISQQIEDITEEDLKKLFSQDREKSIQKEV